MCSETLHVGPVSIGLRDVAEWRLRKNIFQVGPRCEYSGAIHGSGGFHGSNPQQFGVVNRWYP
jgi:hypothetical protein